MGRRQLPITRQRIAARLRGIRRSSTTRRAMAVAHEATALPNTRPACAPSTAEVRRG